VGHDGSGAPPRRGAESQESSLASALLAWFRAHYLNLTVNSGYFDGYTTRWRSGNGIARGNLPRMYAIPRRSNSDPATS